MKKQLFLVAVLVSLLLSTNLIFSRDLYNNTYQVSKITNWSAARFLKLGNDLRDLGQYDEALDILTTGLKYALKSGDEYWIAVAYQYLGLCYRDTEEYDISLKYLRAASRIYSRIISDDFIGSPDIIIAYIEQVKILMKDNILIKPENDPVTPGINGIGEIKNEIKKLKDLLAELNKKLEALKGLTSNK